MKRNLGGGQVYICVDWDGMKIEIPLGKASDITVLTSDEELANDILSGKIKTRRIKEELKNEKALQRLLWRTGKRHSNRG